MSHSHDCSRSVRCTNCCCFGHIKSADVFSTLGTTHNTIVKCAPHIHLAMNTQRTFTLETFVLNHTHNRCIAYARLCEAYRIGVHARLCMLISNYQPTTIYLSIYSLLLLLFEFTIESMRCMRQYLACLLLFSFFPFCF